jgi:hypothetical protein
MARNLRIQFGFSIIHAFPRPRCTSSNWRGGPPSVSLADVGGGTGLEDGRGVGRDAAGFGGESGWGVWAGVVAGVDCSEEKGNREDGAVDTAVVGAVSGVRCRSRSMFTERMV